MASAISYLIAQYIAQLVFPPITWHIFQYIYLNIVKVALYQAISQVICQAIGGDIAETVRIEI